MTGHSVAHATFTLERSYGVAPDRVFEAWADPQAKARWFAGEGAIHHELDFRAGGREVTQGQHEGSTVTFDSTYHEIVPGERIVYASTLSFGELVATVSITAVEFHSDGAGTRLALTEQGTYLDERELPAWREQGTSDWLDKLIGELQAAKPSGDHA